MPPTRQPVVADARRAIQLVDIREQEAAVILIVSGELDRRSTPMLERELERIWQSDHEFVILDLRRVEFMDSAGLRCVVLAHRRAEQQGRRLGIAQGASRARELLRRSGVSQLLTVAATPEEGWGERAGR
jgi:anti-sigma B factor antagonist